MGKLRVLKSIGHNTAHSYLSQMSYVNGEYTVKRLFNIAKKFNESNIMIHILDKSIYPESFRTPEIQISLNYLYDNFLKLLDAEKLTIQDVHSAIINIKFVLCEHGIDDNSLEKQEYTCVVILEDKNGKTHESNVVEWWKY